ncbi:hypothetical protein [Pseudochryseolinea flava]|uniref:DUF3592 domain-containing protein n=1 Tax=Pseudochryseolinea flava TaxID=2059302 RepID=A0A364Y3K9_9BACT|nr:hypothetical protein [Pseudochryseolinea flava]RAW00376.1 hypothetical protein DQQ10_15095 [Pseudochryseolinea flava]
MNTRRKIWAGLTVFVVILFCFLIPVHVFEGSPMMFSFLGGALLFVTLGQTLADFDAIYEVFDKPDPNEPQPPGRKMAPFAIIPGFIFVFILLVMGSSRKDAELKQYGVLVKGAIVDGSSTTTTRRFQKNTSYDLMFSYEDSTGRKHQFEQSVNGSEFHDAYMGQAVDILYSKKHPSLAKAILSLSELSNHIKIADAPIQVQQLISILESSKPDTIVNFLNGISYQWDQKSDGVYANEKRNLAIKVFPGNQELAYMDNSSTALNHSNKDFESSLESYGFKKKAVADGNQSQELYYTEKYGVTKENKMVNGEDGALGFSVVTIYHVFLFSSLGE